MAVLAIPSWGLANGLAFTRARACPASGPLLLGRVRLFRWIPQ